jgi:hypothetical protein
MTLHMSPESIIARNKAKQKQWRIDHPDRIKDFHRKYNAKPGVIIRKTQWARDHRDEINARRRETYRTRHEDALQNTEAPTEPVV